MTNKLQYWIELNRALSYFTKKTSHNKGQVKIMDFYQGKPMLGHIYRKVKMNVATLPTFLPLIMLSAARSLLENSIGPKSWFRTSEQKMLSSFSEIWLESPIIISSIVSAVKKS